MKITNDVVLQATHQLFQNMFDYDDVGLLVTTSENNLLSFIEDQKYVPQLNNNNSIKGIFCTQEIASSGLIRADIDLIVVDEPKWFFFSIVDYLAKNQERQTTIIDSSSEISSQAYISPVGVKIGKNCQIDPNVTILSDVTIGDNVIIVTTHKGLPDIRDILA